MKVAIVGAGPAGAFCAERLARTGHTVELFDPSHPREKPCGGGVTPGTFANRPELRPLIAQGNSVSRIRLTAGAKGDELAIDMPDPIVVFSREKLDGMLLERACEAGARHRPQRVTKVWVDDAGAWLTAGGKTQRYDFVVGADGTSSRVRRALVGQRPGSDMSYASAGFHVEGIEEEDFFVEFLSECKGYLWVFPRNGHASVGVVAPVGTRNGKALSKFVLDTLERRYPGSLSLPRTPYAASIPVADVAEAKRPTLGGPRFALVGDAANLTDPVTGEGIQHAIESGGMLAAALDESDPQTAAALYASRWMEHWGRDLLACTRIARYLYWPWSVRLTLHYCERSTRLQSLLVDCLMVSQPYSKIAQRVMGDFTPFAQRDSKARRNRRHATAPGAPHD